MNDTNMCILGVDPGTMSTGYCFLGMDGKSVIQSGVISMVSQNAKAEARICSISNILLSYIKTLQNRGYIVGSACIEDQFMHRNPKVTKLLSRIVGAILFVIYYQTGVVSELVPPESAKKSFGVYSSDFSHIASATERKQAIHQEVQNRALELFGIVMEDDEAFASAMAYHLYTKPIPLFEEKETGVIMPKGKEKRGQTHAVR